MTSETPKQTGTVLLVDDDADFLLQQKILLEQAGFTVLTAESSKEAGPIAERENIDIAIVDLMMEDVDSGFALCYHIKQNKPNLPIIMVTGVQSETGIEFDAGTDEERSWVKADVMLTKPVRVEQLTAEIDRLMRIAQAQA